MEESRKVRGTKDYLNVENYNYLINSLREHFINRNFIEIKLPIIESIDLFKRTLGLSTDIISKEMYILKNIHEKSSEEICLRPESTTSNMRAYIENGIQKAPWKTFTYGSMFRHERPQKGRYREFTQFSIEILNGKSEFFDVEILLSLNEFFQKIKIQKYSLEINFIGSLEDRKKYEIALKNYIKENFPTFLFEKIEEIYNKNVFRLLDSKDVEIQKEMIKAPIIENFYSEETLKSWEKIKKILDLMLVKYHVNPYLFRGLDYYNNLVFEFKSDFLGAQNTFCAGGRYDGLSKIFNSKYDFPSIGASVGIERILLCMEQVNKKNKEIAIISMEEEYNIYAMNVSVELSRNKILNEVFYDKNGLKSGLRKANNENYFAAIIIGENEYNAGILQIKYLETGEQKLITFEDLHKII